MLIRARSGGASLRSRPAFGTYGVNYDSAQSQRLLGWMPMHGGVMHDIVQNIAFYRTGTTDVPCLSTELGLIPATLGASSVAYANNEATRYDIYSTGVGRDKPFTICAWVRWDGSGSQSFATHATATGNYYGVEIGLTTDGKPFLQYGDGTGSSSTDRRTLLADSAIAANVWMHVIYHCQNATNWTIYVNGIAVAATGSGTGGGLAITATRKAAYGRGYNGSYTTGAGSLLTDLRLYRLEVDTYPTAEWIDNQYERPTDLYWQPSRRLWVQVTAAAARPLPQRAVVGPTVGPFRGPF